MLIHLGEDVIVNMKDVIAILDKQLLESSTIVNEFLDNQKNNIIELSNGGAKSIVITMDHIYFSPFSSSTLKKRSQLIFDFD